MCKDPFDGREARRYKNPIASREAIIAYIEKAGKAVKFSAINKYFFIKNVAQKNAMDKRLDAMIRDGQISKNRHKKYFLVENTPLQQCTVIKFKDGLALVQDQSNSWFILSRRHSCCLMLGDIVSVRVGQANYAGHIKAILVEIITRGKSQVVGCYVKEGGKTYVKLSQVVMQSDLVLITKTNVKVELGDYVVVKIKQYPEDNQLASGWVEKVITNESQLNFEIDLAIGSFELPCFWSKAVKEEVKQLPSVADSLQNEQRTDLRDLAFVTIDGETAKDFDDAIFVEQKSNKNWLLWVAIADVSYYVRPGSAIDQEAKKRGCSVYFPEQVLPMLPEILSNELCSLKPNIDRLAVVVKIELDHNAAVINHQFMRAVIKSQARLTYNQIYDLEDKVNTSAFVRESLKNADVLAKMLAKEQQKRGAINFQFQETQLVFNKEGFIDHVKPVKRLFAHELIESFMLCANSVVARSLINKKIAALFRVHKQPDMNKLAALKESLKALNLPLKTAADNLQPKSLQEILDKAKGRDDYELIQILILRSLTQAVYQAKNEGHFGLAYECYTHFTSPIRRYPDLLVHRALCDFIIDNNKQNNEIDYDLLGQNCSLTERRADTATKKVADKLKCYFMQKKVGKEFSGTVACVTNFGLFVRLDEFLIDGLLHISELTGDYYNFDSEKNQLVGDKHGKVYKIGSAIKIKVKQVNVESGFIDFAFA